MRKLFIAVLFLLVASATNLFSQTFLMPTSGYKEIHTQTGTLYDDGGASGNYSTRVNARTTIYPVTPGAKIRLTGSHDLEAPNFSRIIIYDGDTNSSNILYNGYFSAQGLVLCSSSGPVTVHFTVDTDSPKSGFAFVISEYSYCPDKAYNVSVKPTTETTALVSWQGGSDSTKWILEYGEVDATCHFLDSTKREFSDTNFLVLDSLIHCQKYGVRIYTPCDTLESTCMPPLPIKCWIQCECPQPFGFIKGSGVDTVSLAWSETDTNLVWSYELIHEGQAIDSGTTTNPYVGFGGLDPDTEYHIKVWNDCHNNGDDCNAIMIASYTMCPCKKPLYSSASVGSDSIYFAWSESDTSIVWRVQLYQGYSLVYSFLSYDNFATFKSLSSATNYKVRIYEDCLPSYDTAFAGHYCNYLDVDYRTPCHCPVAENVQITNVTDNSISLSWDIDPYSPGWIIQYRLRNSATSYIDTSYTYYHTISGLTQTGYYEIWVHSLCDSLKIGCASKMVLINVPSSGNCLDYTNLKSTSNIPTYGIYSNPYRDGGLVDYGYNNISSRHTVHYDIAEKDPRTGNQLSTVPPGEKASVRLGNSLSGSEAESITYRYHVDTNNFSLMILKYAIVFQDPNHSITEQPRFTLQILDENLSYIDSVCGVADFYADSSALWHSVADTNIIWKDWTTVGFDLAKYHDKVINIRLTTYDCKQGGHFGYAYFALSCSTQALLSSSCGETSSNTFTAPIGFSYRWYSSADTSLTLSTNRSLDVVVDSTLSYFCEVSSLENPSCSFILDAYGGRKFPIADFNYTYTIEDCAFVVKFNNISTVSYNGSTPSPNGEPCDAAKWVFEDGVIIDQYSPTRKFSTAGDYKVRLIVSVGNFECADTIDKIIHLAKDGQSLVIIGDSSLCIGEGTVLTSSLTGEYIWNTGDTTKSISLTPTVSNTYYIYLIDTSGCINRALKDVYVHPIWDSVNIVDTICDNNPIDGQGYYIDQSGNYILYLQSTFGCDSTVYLTLTVKKHYTSDTIYAFTCDNVPYTEHGLNADTTGIYSSVLQGSNGCDSIINVNLFVYPTFTDTIFAEIYKGGVYNLHGFNESTKGFYTHALKSIHGCDSVLNLDLQVDNILFPNVVTANGDGINDVFSIHNLLEQDAFPENELIIFNRQGKLIYSKQNINSVKDYWDPQSTSSPTGTYFFRFIGKRPDKNIDYLGIIEVIR